MHIVQCPLHVICSYSFRVWQRCQGNWDCAGLATESILLKVEIFLQLVPCDCQLSRRVNEPVSVELAMAGVCAAILLAACQDTAAQFLTWSHPGRARSGAAAVAGALMVHIPWLQSVD